MRGCEHYASNVLLSAPCCGEFYVCRFCHDAEQAHKIDRRTVSRLCCLACNHEQPVSDDRHENERCGKCKSLFARYYCHECKLYDDNPEKEIFHCDKCRACRVGRAEDFFHCDGCGVCMSLTLREKHKCLRGALEGACAVCAEDLGDSTKPVTVLDRCGHALHASCFAELRAKSFQCPICKRSAGDTTNEFRRIDELLAKYRVPPEYTRFKAKVLCADCNATTLAPYHVVYHKCASCGSYSTKVLGHERVLL